MKLYRINALLLKYYYITKNRIDRIFDIIYWPLLDLLIWGFASSFIEDISNYNIMSMVLGGIILWVFVWRAGQDMAVYVLEDFWSRNTYHLYSSPVKTSEHVISIIIFGMLRSIATFTVLSILAGLIYSFNILSIPLFFVVIAATLLSLFGWVIGTFVIAMIMRYGKRIQVLAWSIIWIIQPFSCVFYPLKSLPEWAQPISSKIPTTYIFENLRSVVATGTVNAGELWYAFFANMALFILAIIFLKYSMDKARETGLLAKAD